MILVTSSMSVGSWQIRGEQLGKAIGATVANDASADRIAKADLIVVVKRASPVLLQRLKAACKPIVLDIVDAWPQPVGNTWDEARSIAWLKNYVAGYSAVGAVCTTMAMANALSDQVTTLVLPHHSWPGRDENPIREVVRTIGYEGSPRYLDGWQSHIDKQCQKRDWNFVVNPRSLTDLDIVLALRGGPWRGWMTDNFKSNVKLANAQATGTPIILMPELASLESQSGGEVWIEHPKELSAAFDLLEPLDERLKRSEQLRALAPKLEVLAETYLSWLKTLKS